MWKKINENEWMWNNEHRIKLYKEDGEYFITYDYGFPIGEHRISPIFLDKKLAKKWLEKFMSLFPKKLKLPDSLIAYIPRAKEKTKEVI